MKKDKLKAERKKIKKELEGKLAIAFNAIANEYGQAKKAKSIIEKFAKQLSKKIELKKEIIFPIPEQKKTKEVKTKPTKAAPEKTA